MLKAALANLFAAKFVAVGGAACAAVATGGLAVAAATGNLPLQNDHRPVSTVALATDTPTGTPTGTPGDDETPSPTPSGTATPTPQPGASATPKAVPNPSLDGLCNAFFARDVDEHGKLNEHGKADDSAAFSVLVTTAGGKDKVLAYCVTRIGTPKPHGDHNDNPTPSASPSVTPAGEHHGGSDNGRNDDGHGNGH